MYTLILLKIMCIYTEVEVCTCVLYIKNKNTVNYRERQIK